MVLLARLLKGFGKAHGAFLIFPGDAVVAKLWPEETDTLRYVGPTNCSKTGNCPNSSLAATSLIVID